MTTNKSESLRPRRRRSAQTLLATAVGFAVLANGGPAQAAIDPATATQVIGYIKKGYEVYKTVKTMLGDKAPTLAEQLADVQAAIINEMRTQRNQALKSAAGSVFDMYRNLSDNSRTDPTNAGLFNEILTLQYQTARAMEDIIAEGNDPASSYQLAPALNALLVTGTGVLRIKGEIWRNDPSSWGDHHFWLRDGIRANYQMVGSQRHQCWTGKNPGWRPMPSLLDPTALVNWLNTTESGKYKDSQLYRYLSNKTFSTGPYSTLKWTCNRGVPMSRPGGDILCNPIERDCWWSGQCGSAPADEAIRSAAADCDRDVSPMACADELARDAFSDNQVVRIIRAGMVGTMSLSGGNQTNASWNDPLLAVGMYVDPRVKEASCDDGQAYPHVP